MCGRFTIAIEPAELMEEFDLPEAPSDWVIRYNVAPSQMIPVIMDAEKKAVEKVKWGLIPGWAKDPDIGNRLINARAETILEKPTFRNAFSKRRCLIVADGFFEWKRDLTGKMPSQPYRFIRKDKKPFAFAGLWEIWKDKHEVEIKSTVIITCAANSVVSPIHERMPVILPHSLYWKWLQETSLQTLQEMLIPFPDDQLQSYPVGKLVNKPENDSSACVEQVLS